MARRFKNPLIPALISVFAISCGGDEATHGTTAGGGGGQAGAQGGSGAAIGSSGSGGSSAGGANAGGGGAGGAGAGGANAGGSAGGTIDAGPDAVDETRHDAAIDAGVSDRATVDADAGRPLGPPIDAPARTW